MRTKLFCLCVFLLLAALLVFGACGQSSTEESSGLTETSAPAAFSTPSENSGEIVSDGSEEESVASSATSDISDTGDTSGDASGGEEKPVLKNPDYEYLATQLEEPFAVWDKLSPATVTVENPYTDNERWKLWWGETCLHTFGEGTRINVGSCSVYADVLSERVYVLTLFTDGGPAVVTDRDGKTVELAQARPCALLNAEGEVIIPFGEYERLEPVNSAYLIGTVSADEAYILNVEGERISEKYAFAEACPSRNLGTFDAFYVDAVGIDGEAFGLRLTQSGELEEVPAHTPPVERKLANAYVCDAMVRQLKPFFEALQNGDRAGIVAVIGEERYNEAAALVDTLEPDYEPYQDYTTKTWEEQDADKYMAWLLKYARYIGTPGLRDFPEDDGLSLSEQAFRGEFFFEGFNHSVHTIAWVADDGSGDYPLLDWGPGVTYFQPID